MKLTEFEQALFNKWETKEDNNQEFNIKKYKFTENFFYSGAFVAVISAVLMIPFLMWDRTYMTVEKAIAFKDPSSYPTIFGVHAAYIWIFIFILSCFSAVFEFDYCGLAVRKLKKERELEFRKSLQFLDLDVENSVFLINKRATIFASQYEELSDKIQTQIKDIDQAETKLKEIEKRTEAGSRLVLLHNILKEINEVKNNLIAQGYKATDLYTSVFGELDSSRQALREQADLTEILKSQRLISASKFIVEENKIILLNMENCLALFEREFKALSQDYTASYDAMEELRMSCTS